jgi:hypothetical protein
MSWHLGLRLPSDGLAVPSPDPVRIALRYASLVVTVRAYVADHARPCVCPLCLALWEIDHPEGSDVAPVPPLSVSEG